MKTKSNLKSNAQSVTTPPWWRIGPLLLAIVALALVPSFGERYGSEIQSREMTKLNVSSAVFQEESTTSEIDLPEIQLPDIQLPDVPPEASDPANDYSAEALQNSLRSSMSEDQLSAADLAAANQMVETLAPADWLGPLAPVALSPFFGITCLSGLALWSPDWMPGNGLLNSATPLKNPTLFWSFAALTIITSLPRLSKVSKPIAAAVDKVEAYAGIITLIIIRFMASPSDAWIDSPEIVEAGIVSSSIDVFLYGAMVINVLVINSVKFFFEFLIWLTPIPFLDACFEVANKAACVFLMAIYSFSPTLATLLNITMFVVCLLVLRWISRRVKFYRHMMFDSLWPMVSATYGRPSTAELIVFPKHDWRGFQDKACLTLKRNDDGWLLHQTRLLRSPLMADLPPDAKLTIKQGWLTNTIEINGEQPVVMIFSRRYHARLQDVADLLGAEVEVTESASDQRSAAKAEFV